MTTQKISQQFQEKAHRLIPGGAHTYSRGDDQFPANAPAVLERGKGAYVWDADSNSYLDYGMALRAVTLGYCNERVNNAAVAEILKGNNLTRASVTEIRAAETLCDIIPGADMVKFAKNGSTVTSAGVKISRAYTGKKHVLRCKEHPFFSYDDWFIGDTEMKLGVPKEISALTLNFQYNDLASAEAAFERCRGDIACVILEPVAAVDPAPSRYFPGTGKNFLHDLQELCRKKGAVFILDEMITGFRWDLRGAAAFYGVTPDLLTFGKGMANGFSVAALVGKRDIMSVGSIKGDRERVFLISTTHGAEMCGLGAFMETVKIYQEQGVTSKLWSYGKSLIDGATALSKELGLERNIKFHGFPCSPAYTTLDKEGCVSLPLRTLLAQELIKRGVLMPWIALSAAHGDKELEITLTALRGAFQVCAQALEHGIERYLVGLAIKPVFRRFN